MKSLLEQIENLLEEKVRKHFEENRHFNDAKAEEIAIQKLIEIATAELAETLV